jgi:hypothetical protein
MRGFLFWTDVLLALALLGARAGSVWACAGSMLEFLA